MGFFISTMMSLLINLLFTVQSLRSVQPLRSVQTVERLERFERFLFSMPRWPFFRLDQASMRAVAIGMILGSPAAADGDGCRLVKFQNMRRDISDGVRAVAERRVFRPCAATIGHAL